MAAICFNADSGPCTVCGAKGRPCAKCRVDYYCSSDHQRQDWQRHKKGCGVIEVQNNALLGRHVVAVKDIPAATVVMRDSPVILVPNVAEQVYCAGCCSLLTGGWTACCHCGWPVCSKDCRETASHRAECAAFQRAQFKLNRGDVARYGTLMWRALGALKTHFACEANPRVRDLQSDLADQSPLDVARGGLCAEVQDAVHQRRSDWREAAQWLRAKGLHWLSEKDLYRAAGLNDVNAITVILSPMQALAAHGTGRPDGSAGAVYAGISLLEHDCTPTATHNVDVPPFSNQASGDRLVVTARDIRAGEHLSIDYLDLPLLPASKRRSRLRGWGFICRCNLCEDPTERGLYLDSACCAACKGRGERHYMLADEVSAEPARWRCDSCGHVVRDERPDWLAASVLEALMEQDGTVVADYERFVERHLWPQGVLHPTHHLVLDAKMNALNLVQPQIFSMISPPKDEILHLVALCKDLLSAMDVAGRFMCSRRGNVLGPLSLFTKMLLRSEMADAGLEAPKTLADMMKMRSFAPRVRELEALLTQMKGLMMPAERRFFEQTQGKELEMLLVMTGCKAPSMSDMATAMQGLQ